MTENRRAVDDRMKDEIIARLAAAWKAHPELRLMQLIGNAFKSDPYNVEDYDAIAEIEYWAARWLNTEP